MAGSGDELAAGAGDRNRLRASDADREQVIEVLKTAFVQGRLTMDELVLRVTQVYASRTYADLDALTADVPAPLTKAQPPKPAPEPDPDRKKLAASGGLAGTLTWYDVLGVLPGASPGQVESAYYERARLLDLRMLNGAPSKVLKAADAARATVGEAWHILQDAAARRRYDELIAVGRNGEGLGSALSTPSVPGSTPFGGYVTADVVIAALEDLMMPHPSPPRRVIVPDLRGLFMRSCLQVIGDLGLHVEMVQLTEHPMPVEGLVVDQSPLPGAEVSRSSTLTVEIWHPPSRSVVSGVLRISRHYRTARHQPRHPAAQGIELQQRSVAPGPAGDAVPARRYRVPVARIVPARAVHRQALAALGPGFAVDGFERLRPGSTAVWARPSGTSSSSAGWLALTAPRYLRLVRHHRPSPIGLVRPADSPQ